jgi:outer membrane receptor protein involved in Fe transport
MTLAAAVSAAFAAAPALADDPPENSGALEAIVVTAQKREENLQEIPFSIQALGTEKLEELHVQSLDDYVKFLPSVTYVRSQGEGGAGQPGTAHVYMRGVTNGGDGNHSGPLPSVGVYLDEQPVTTIDGNLDVHIYDIERIEVLAGPQGTLYGASSEAGTIRIITNKPDPKRFSASYDLSVDTVEHGTGLGHVAEGYVNVPLRDDLAIRLVGWDEHDAGFINNIAGTNVSAGIVDGTRTFPTWNSTAYGGSGAFPGVVGDGAISNQSTRRNGYNTVDTKGGRAALKYNIADSWTITPTVMSQNSVANGFFGYDPVIGDLDVTHFGPERSTDTFTQTALTVEGKVANLDMTYATAYMRRDSHSIADYSDYSFFYDVVFGSGPFWVGNNGLPIMPQQQVIDDNWFTKMSQELRFTTPKRYQLKGTFGAFMQRQVHEIYQRYYMGGYDDANGFSDALSVPGWANTIWLTDEQRVDKDSALFAQGTWDFDPKFSLTAGWRQFWYDNSLLGFYGYSGAYSSPGSGICGNSTPFQGAPCIDLAAETKDSGHTPLLTLTYFNDDDRMFYLTYSKGFRPGGVNRAKDPITGEFAPPYSAEYLVNYELGWKTQWLNQHLRWNGAIFRENWNDFQFAHLVPPSLTIISNAGRARINGVESELEWAVTRQWTLSANMTVIDSKLEQNVCCYKLPDGNIIVTAYAGDRLPVTPIFKGDLIARYTFRTGEYKNNVQASVTHQGSAKPVMTDAEAAITGDEPGYTLADLSGGTEFGNTNVGLFITNVFDTRAELTRFSNCRSTVCGETYIIPAQPRTIGIKFGQKF